MRGWERFNWERHGPCRQEFHTLDDAAGSALIGNVMTLAAKNFQTPDDAAEYFWSADIR